MQQVRRIMFVWSLIVPIGCRTILPEVGGGAALLGAFDATQKNTLVALSYRGDPHKTEILRIDGSKKRVMATTPYIVSQLTCLPSRGVVVSAWREGDRKLRLYQLSDSGKLTPLPSPPQGAQDDQPSSGWTGHLYWARAASSRSYSLGGTVAARYDLFANGPHGTRQITSAGFLTLRLAPKCSDGKTTVFTAFEKGQGERIHVLKNDDPATLRVLGTKDVWAVSLSRDGKKICYIQGIGSGDVFVANTDGSNARRLTSLHSRMSRAEFSEDGSEVFYSVDPGRNDHYQIWKVPASGGNAQKVLE